jgi:hypothetical protein
MSTPPVLLLSTWDGYTPVMLPYGAKTMDGIVAASNGVLVPFVIFVLFLFRFLYHHQWVKEYNRLSGGSALTSAPKAADDRVPIFSGRVVGPMEGIRHMEGFRYPCSYVDSQQSPYMPSQGGVPVWTCGGNGGA